MKKLLSVLCVMMFVFVLVGCGQAQTKTNQGDDSQTSSQSQEQPSSQVIENDQNILIAYYSYSGNTEEAAKQIQTLTNGDLVEITRTEDYGDDFYDVAESEIDNGDQPEITVSLDSLDAYDVVFIGYPIWWEKAPAMINTFVHQYDFSGKTVVPFCTSSSDGIEASLDVFDDIQDVAEVKEGLRIEDYADIPDWLNRVLEV